MADSRRFRISNAVAASDARRSLLDSTPTVFTGDFTDIGAAFTLESGPTAPVAWASKFGDRGAVRAAILGEGRGEDIGAAGVGFISNSDGVADCREDGVVARRSLAMFAFEISGLPMERFDRLESDGGN